jgi:hypothetical protein
MILVETDYSYLRVRRHILTCATFVSYVYHRFRPDLFFYCHKFNILNDKIDNNKLYDIFSKNKINS